MVQKLVSRNRHGARLAHTDVDAAGNIITQPNEALGQQLRDKIRQTGVRYDRSTAVVEVSLELRERATLYWGYEPEPGILVPMRLLTEDGLTTNIVAGMKDETAL